MTTHTPTPKRRRWVVHAAYSVGIAVALFAGVGIGAADEPETVTETVEDESQDLLDQIAALEDELDAADVAEGEPDEPANDDDLFRAKIGETITLSQDGREVAYLTVSDVDVVTSPQNSYGEMPRHDQFLVFTVDLEGIATTSLYGDDFYIRTEDGTRYDEGDGNSWDAIGDLDDLLGYQDVNAGDKVSGKLVYDVPDEPAELTYAPNYQAGPIGVWEF